MTTGNAVVCASHLSGAPWFVSERFTVAGIECADPLDYWRGLAAQWDGPAVIVNVEHDVAATDDLIAELLACPHPKCSYAYLLYWVSTGAAVPHFAQREGPQPPAGGRWISPGEEWCDYTGIGLIKVEPAARVRPLAESPWQHLDIQVSAATSGRWHVHWGDGQGVAHHHT